MRKPKQLWKMAMVSALVTGSVVAVAPVIGSVSASQFQDFKPGSSSYDAVMNLASRGIINGFDDGTYRPNQAVTRGQAAKLLAEILELDLTNVKDPKFKDIPQSHPYYRHIAALANKGVISGYGDGRFGANDFLNRGQMAKILAKSFEFSLNELSLSPFNDVYENDQYAEYIQALFDLKVTTGTTPTTYSPYNIVTRGQMAMFLFRSDAVKFGSYVDAKVKEIKDGKIITSEGSYAVSDALKLFFSADNAPALNGAQTAFRIVSGKVIEVERIEFNTAATVFDGGSASIKGNLNIQHDNLHVKNLQVKGKTLISDDHITKIVKKASIVFDNVTLNEMEITKKDPRVEFKNNSTVRTIQLSQNVVIYAMQNSKISKVNVLGAVTEVEVNANVDELEIKTLAPIVVSGTGSIAKMSVKTNAKTTLNITGMIGTLELSNNSLITLSKNTKIRNLTFLKGLKAEDLISNFNEVKHNIQEINGQKNPAYVAPTPTNPPSTDTGSNPTAPIVTGVDNGAFYNKDVIPEFNKGRATISFNKGEALPFISGTKLIEEGSYKLVVDNSGKKTTVEFVIDKTTPIVTGVGDGIHYNVDVSLTFNEGTALLSKDGGEGESFESGTIISEEGSYELVVNDEAGNKTVVTFVVDKTAPIITGVEDGDYYNKDVSPAFNEGTAALSFNNGEPTAFASDSSVSDEGSYKLVVTDEAGNATTVEFVIDKTVPIVIGVGDGIHYNAEVAPIFNEGTALLSKDGGDGKSFDSGTIIGEEGSYKLVVTDKAGNETTVTFTIDKTAPLITGVSDGKAYRTDVTPIFEVDAMATLQKNNEQAESFDLGTSISDEGNYELVVTDLAGNETTVKFIIDKTDPIVTGVDDGTHYKVDVSPKFNEGIAVISLNRGDPVSFTSESRLSAEGTYNLIVTDIAENKTIVEFVIDKTPPAITDVIEGKFYNTNIAPVYNEGKALLSKNGGKGESFTSGTQIIEDGDYVLIVTDRAGNESTVTFVIDKTHPIVTGVEDGIQYNEDVTPTFNEGEATVSLNNGTTIPFASGSRLNEEGAYKLVVTDEAENKTTVQFIIDKTAPVVSGVENGNYYNKDVAPTFTEGTASISLNGSAPVPFLTGSPLSLEGTYELVVTDMAENETIITFVVDKTSPVITNVIEGKFYNTNAAPFYNEGTALLSRNGGNGESFASGTPISAEGNYELVVTDEAGNKTTVTFIIDKTAPTVTGVDNEAYYNKDVTPIFSDGTATISSNGGKPVSILSGVTLIEEGSYKLVVTDEAGNVTSVEFVIDKTSPVITDVIEGKFYNTNVAPVYNEGTALLSKNGGNSKSFASGTPISEDGIYELVVTDEAGNKTTVTFIIDKTAPIVSGVNNGAYYNKDVTPTFNEGTAVISYNNGTSNVFTSGNSLRDEGAYKLVVTDEAGNKTTIEFGIDRTSPIITEVENGVHYKADVSPEYDEGTASISLNGGAPVPFLTGSPLSAEGTYKLVVTDKAGNETSVEFVIDKTAPTISSVVNGSIYNTAVTPVFNEGTALLNGENFVSGTSISKDGEYVLVVTDKAGNVATVTFTIDQTPPVVTGVSDGSFYNKSVKPTFNEGTAVLSKDGENGESFESGTPISEDGSYTLVVTDAAGNMTTVSFTIDTVKPTLKVASINSTNSNPGLARAGDTVTLLIKADEDVSISDAISKIGGTIAGTIQVTDAADNDASTWEISFIVGSQVEGAVEIELLMTDTAGNETKVNSGMATDGSKIDADGIAAVINYGVIESTNSYVDIFFSEGVYGGSLEDLRALETADFAAIITNGRGYPNPVIVFINNVTKPDGMPLEGGESVVRVHLSFIGTLIQGDTIEIKAAGNAIFDKVGNETGAAETTGSQTLTPLVEYFWNAADNTITFTKGLTVSPYSNTKVRLTGDKHDMGFFLTTPTPIGGSKQLKISVSAGWDHAFFGATANGIYAQATAANTIQFSADTTCSSGGCPYLTVFYQDHLFVIIEDPSDPSIKTILDLNIDSRRPDPIRINSVQFLLLE